MTVLSPEMKRLLEVARDGADPSSAELDAVGQALATTLGSSAGTATVTSTAGVLGGTAVKVAVVTVVLAGSAALWQVLKTDAPPPVRNQPETPAMAAPVEEPPVVQEVSEPATAPTEKPPAEKLTPTPAKKAKVVTETLRVSEEAKLLREAQRALREGRGAEATRLLDEYDSKFDKGVLRAEAEAARTLNLCRKDSSVAPQAAASFLQKYPDSPAAGRVRQECGTPKR